MMWAAEPHLEARKRIGFQVMIFLIVFAGLLYFTKKKVWAARISQSIRARGALHRLSCRESGHPVDLAAISLGGALIVRFRG